MNQELIIAPLQVCSLTALLLSFLMKTCMDTIHGYLFFSASVPLTILHSFLLLKSISPQFGSLTELLRESDEKFSHNLLHLLS